MDLSKSGGDKVMLPIGWTNVIHGAGGIVWRLEGDELKLLLIRRDRYGDEWSFPKGKLKVGEAWEDAALREVEEETGCVVKLLEFAGGQIYRTNKRPKVVLYWHMKCVQQTGQIDKAEVKQLLWTSVEKALEILTYPRERRMLEDALIELPPSKIKELLLE